MPTRWLMEVLGRQLGANLELREVRESGVNLGVWRVLVVFEATGLDRITQEVRGVGINGEEG